MKQIQANIRAGGSGPAVVLLHSSGSSGRQWDALAETLKSRFRLHAVDLYGHGATPPWSGDRPLTLFDEAALVEPLLAAHPEGVHLVGHSYGGAVALKLALRHADRVRSLVLYEPVLFCLLFEYNAQHAAAQQVLATATSIRNGVERGMNEAAGRRFVDFWSGAGTWDAMPEQRRAVVTRRMPSVQPHFRALFNDTLSRAELAQLRMPTLCLTGAGTVAATRRIGELLRVALPAAHHEMLPEMGHLGPVTHASRVNARIAAFLDAEVTLQQASMRVAA
jgi:pimeloyl-ACP methyl ester carboxylesterase